MLNKYITQQPQSLGCRLSNSGSLNTFQAESQKLFEAGNHMFHSIPPHLHPPFVLWSSEHFF